MNETKVVVVDNVPKSGDENTIYIVNQSIMNNDGTANKVVKGFVFQGGLCWDISPENDQEKEELNKLLEDAGITLRF